MSERSHRPFFITLTSAMILILLSCTMRMPRDLSASEQLLAQLDDSLQKDGSRSYRLETDSLDYTAWGAVVNSRRIAIITRTDSSAILFTSTDNRWQQTDSFAFPSKAFDFETKQLNEDSLTDLIIAEFPNMHGQCRPYVLLAGSSGYLHYRPNLSLYNIRYNKKSGYVESFYVGGARSLHHKAIYQWVGDSLQLVKRIELDLEDDVRITTRMFEIKDGKKVKTLEVEGENDVYDKGLFPLVE